MSNILMKDEENIDRNTHLIKHLIPYNGASINNELFACWCLGVNLSNLDFVEGIIG